jgi:hypothetical protein
MMQLQLLVPDNIAKTNGAGPAIELGADPEKLMTLTLAIDRVLEQEALQISIWGSTDANDWGLRPLTSFPPKSYCGTYSQLIDMSRHPGVRYLRAEWKVSRWAKPASEPLFEFCLMLEPPDAHLRRPAGVAASSPLKSAIA